MIKFIGRHENLALFSHEGRVTAVDTDANVVADISESEILSFSFLADPEALDYTPVHEELATAALSAIEEPIVAGGSSMYTIPGGVQKEAKKGLEWRKEHKRGGTKVGYNTASRLAKGGQIGIEKIRHIAKYFPRHEVDKKAKGYKPGEDNYPSNGRIAWALWGGDAAQRWASSIVERENKKAKKKAQTASGYGESYDADMNAFKMAHELDMNAGPEFLARVRMDGSGIDRLYKIDIDGRVYIWDDCAWDDLGHVDGDIYFYDRTLDEPYDTVEKTHVMIDPSSAVIISAFMQERPFEPVLLEEIDPEETLLMSEGLQEEDFTMIDRVMTAAGEPVTDKDGNYTEEERSAKAQNQPRDAGGKFVSAGARTVVGGDKVRGSGTITEVDSKTGKVKVRLDTGKEIEVDAKFTQAEADVEGPRAVPKVDVPLDTSGILGEPRMPKGYPKAQLPGTMAPMEPKDFQDLINNWGSYVGRMRESYKPRNEEDRKRVNRRYGTDFAITAAAQTPKDSDIPAKYLAIVSPDDLGAVMDLVAIVPESPETTTPVLYERKDGKWVRNDQIMMDLKSATPPPVVELDDEEVLNDVLSQVDDVKGATTASLLQFWEKVVDPLLAAGGLDRNRGGAEKLRRYWTRGVGGAKIMWNTPGDWTRCVRLLSKYMGPRAKGYCQLRHKEMTGVYTGSKYNVGKKSPLAASLFQSEEQFNEAILKRAELSARAQDARQKVGLVAAASKVGDGAKFFIPLVIPEDMESGDGRRFKKDSISIRDLPVPLLWQIKTGSGHDGSVVVGRIDYMEKTENGIGNAYGVFDTGPYGREAERMVKHGFLRGVSADLDQFEAKEEKAENADGQDMGKDKLVINKARVMAATIVAKPAFQECTISIEETGEQEDSVTPTEDGLYEESLEDIGPMEPIMASGYLADEVPVTPPQSWFENPGLSKPTPLTVDPSGRIYGHIAAWHVSHIGLPRSTKPPRSRSKYAYFHTGVVHTDAGKDVPVGQLTLAGGHAPLNADAASAAKHYDDTASAIADVHAGEDEYGIWVAGSLRPGIKEEDVRALRASAPSGDWRPIGGTLELVAVCQVNVPGFPIARAMVAGGKMLALVAAGASFFAVMKSEVVISLADRASKLAELSDSAPDLKSRATKARKELTAERLRNIDGAAESLRERALVAAAVAELAKFTDEEREELAKEGMALPDGSYPIRNEDDLKNAIQAYGRSNPEDRAKVRRHIRKRARALKKVDLVPEHWTFADSSEASDKLASMRETITAAATELSYARKRYDRKDIKEMISGGKAMRDGSFPIDDTRDLKDAIEEWEALADSMNRRERRDAKEHIIKRAKDLGRYYSMIPSSWRSKRYRAYSVTEFAEDSDPTKDELDELKRAKDEADAAEEDDLKKAEGRGGDFDPEEGRRKYISGVDQPRDAKGKYRKVLARLKQDIGAAGLQRALKKVEEAENLDFAGDYMESAAASTDLLALLDRLDVKALNPEALENVRLTAAELGKTIANLPLPFGKDAEKIKYSDLPAGLKDLIEGMMSRVESKIGKEDADIATEKLRSYMSGGDLFSQGEVQSEMSKMLRLLN